MHSAAKPARGGSLEAYEVIERFVHSARQPAIMEPGSDPIAIGRDNFQLTSRGEIVTLEAWTDLQNLVRRIRRVTAEQRGRIEVEVECFGGRSARLSIVDLAHAANRDTSRRGARLKYRERF